MGATPAAGPTLGTRHPTPIRHIFTVTPRIAEELEHVPPQLNQGDSRGAEDGRVYRH
jgi:hypothetical protein